MADLYELETILDYRTLTETYSDYARQGSPNPFFDFYTAGQVKPFPTDTVEFIKLSQVKDPAPTNLRGNPARMLQPTGKGKRRLTMLNMFNAMQLSMDSMQMLRKPDQWVLQSKGREEIEQQFEDFSTRQRITKQVYLAKSLQSTNIYFDANGDILESSSGAAITVPTGIATSHLDGISKTTFGTGSGDVFAVSWSDPAAKILDDLDEMNEIGERLGIEPLRHVWMARQNKVYIRNNDQILDMYATAGGNQSRLDNDLKGDMFEVNNYVFHFYGGTYTNTSGNAELFIDDGRVIITPDPGVNNWYVQGEGMQYVCNTLQPAQTLEQLLASFDEKYGDFAYLMPSTNPPSLTLYMGTNWLWGLRNPDSVFAPTAFF